MFTKAFLLHKMLHKIVMNGYGLRTNVNCAQNAKRLLRFKLSHVKVTSKAVHF